MTQKKKNPVWSFFASVQLALFLLILLASTSIIGTVIPQNQSPESYTEHYGIQFANLMHILNLTDMYNSWWFLSLLFIFSLNLIICSLERIPGVIRIVKKDNLDTDPARLEKMALHQALEFTTPSNQTILTLTNQLRRKGWKAQTQTKDQGTLLFAQKGPWTRFGVYVVHISILVVLLGAVIGSSTVSEKILKNPNFAFKGSIMIPETRSTEHIYSFKDNRQIDLGFSVYCDYFNIEYYDNGMPKTFLSKVRVIDEGKEVIKTDIEVNTPLTYKGITFYQSSYQPYQDFVVIIKNITTGDEKTEIVSASTQVDWVEGGASYGIINKESSREVIRRVKIWFTDNQGEPTTFWLNIGQEATVERPSGNYTFSAKQLYTTGLQVTKDPGVLFVYTGCILMLIGLYIAFFLSHCKIYAFVSDKDNGSKVLFAGSANKNKVGFEKKFSTLITQLQQ